MRHITSNKSLADLKDGTYDMVDSKILLFLKNSKFVLPQFSSERCDDGDAAGKNAPMWRAHRSPNSLTWLMGLVGTAG